MGDDNNFKEPEKEESPPKWARGLGYLLSAVVGAILASQGIIDTLVGAKDLKKEIIRQEGQIESLNTTVLGLSKTQSEFIISLEGYKKEREDLRSEIAVLKQRLDSEISSRQSLEDELEKKEKRIKELELIIAKLTDKKFDSFNG